MSENNFNYTETDTTLTLIFASKLDKTIVKFNMINELQPHQNMRLKEKLFNLYRALPYDEDNDDNNLCKKEILYYLIKKYEDTFTYHTKDTTVMSLYKNQLSKEEIEMLISYIIQSDFIYDIDEVEKIF